MNHLYDKDRRVKLLVDGTPFVNSPLQSQYSKFLNISSGDFNVDINNPLYYNLVFKKAVDKVIVKKDGSNVGTSAVHYPNFVNDFNVVESPGTDTYDISLKYPNLILAQNNGTNLNTIPRKINFGNYLTATENVANNRIDVVGTAPFTLDPTDSAWVNYGYFSGSSGGTNSSGGTSAGSLMMENWQAFNKMVAAFDATLGPYLDWTTGNASTNFVEYSSDKTSATFIRKFNPTFKTQIRITDIVKNRMFIGFSDNLPLPNNAFNFLNGNNGFGIRFDDGQDNTWKIMYNNGLSTNPTPIDSTVTVSANTVYTFVIFADETNARFGVTINGGTPIYVTTASGAPAQTTPMGWSMKYTTQEAVIKHMHFWWLYGKSDK